MDTLADLLKGTGFTWRELQLAEQIRPDGHWPSAIPLGHAMDLQNLARKGLTAEGVHFTGAAGSNINLGGIHNAEAKLAISLRFTLDQDAAADGITYIAGLYVDSDEYLFVYIYHKVLYWIHKDVATLFNLGWPEQDYNAGQTYHVFASLGQATGGGAATDGARLRLDNGTAVTSADVTAITHAANFYLGHTRNDVGDGLIGVMTDVSIYTDDVTEAEEALLSKGIPLADAVERYTMDEGRGPTIYDRGSGGNDGTLSATATWAFGQVRQPCLSLSGIADYAAGSAVVDATGNIAIVWAGKMKSVCDSDTVEDLPLLYLLDTGDEANNRFWIYHPQSITGIIFRPTAGGVTDTLSGAAAFAIDDYAIILCTYDVTNDLAQFMVDGIVVATATGLGVASAALWTARIGIQGANYDVSSTLMWGLVEGAPNHRQGLKLTHELNKFLALGKVL